MNNFDYNGVSRRALIAVNQEYDQATGGKLSDFYTAKDKTEYIEPIRLIEKMTVKVDSVAAHISGRKAPIMNALSKRVDSAFNSMVDTVVTEFDKREAAFTDPENL